MRLYLKTVAALVLIPLWVGLSFAPLFMAEDNLWWVMVTVFVAPLPILFVDRIGPKEER